MILYADTVFKLISPFLNRFERKKLVTQKPKKKKYKAILLGYDRIGYSILRSFSSIRGDCLVIDYSLKVIRKLKAKGIDCVYGDADDEEFLEEIHVRDAKLIVSTVPTKESNLLLLSLLHNNDNTVAIVSAREIGDALELYEKGADYVILPHFLGGRFADHLIKKARANKEKYKKERKKEIQQLQERLARGHQYPDTTRD
jgi:Trk K+ transport system NAD-binding subunit